MKPAIHIRTTEGKAQGKSFLGGSPRVPKDFTWPSWNASPYFSYKMKLAEGYYRKTGKGFWQVEIEEKRRLMSDPSIPLSFLGQLYLDEVPRFGSFPEVPQSGILYFFWDTIFCPPGYEPLSRGSCRVVYASNFLQLEEISYPMEAIPEPVSEIYADEIRFIYPQKGLEFRPCWSSTSYQGTLIPPEEEGEDVVPLSERISDEFPPRRSSEILTLDNSPTHQLLGEPIQLQGGPMEEICQRCFHDLSSGRDINPSPESAYLKKEVKDWQLLLQLDSDDNLGWMWHNSGMVYFWIRKADLKKLDFSNVWCIMQSG